MISTRTEMRRGSDVQVIDLDVQPCDVGDQEAWTQPSTANEAVPAARPIRHLWQALLFLPTLLAGIYAFGMAADRYESETRLVIRSAGKLDLGRAGSGSGVPLPLPTLSPDEGHIARNFILSRDALAFLEARLPIRQMLAGTPADILYAYPVPLWPANREGFFSHYLRFVEANLDASSGILAVKVRAFSAMDAELIASTLVEATEALINRLNLRPSASTVQTAAAEVERLRGQAYAAQEEMTRWRAERRIIDPARLAATYVETVARLSLELAMINAQIGEIQANSPRSPQLRTLTARAAAMRSQVDAEREAMAGATSGLSERLGEYERLALDREFAERSFQSALSVLQIARRDVEQQQLFLEQLVRPGVPDYAAYPKRIFFVLVVLAFNIILLLIARALWRDTRSHATG